MASCRDMEGLYAAKSSKPVHEVGHVSANGFVGRPHSNFNASIAVSRRGFEFLCEVKAAEPDDRGGKQGMQEQD